MPDLILLQIGYFVSSQLIMPLFRHQHIKPAGEFGIWEITEPRSFFLDRLDLTDQELERYKIIKGNLQIEWLASRYLLHFMSGRDARGKLIKDEYGKPHLKDSTHAISMSHSNNMAAVIASPIVCGIDIQLIVDKIERIAPKFMNQAEFDSLDKNQLLHMHLYWGAKECLYKSYGKRKLEFREHILIDPFILDDNDEGTFTGTVKKNTFLARYQLHFKRYDKYVLVYSTQMETYEK
jgi:hypothetical protein